MPKVSLAKVSLNKALTLGVRLPCSGEKVPEAEPTNSKPGWSNGLGYLMLNVAPIAPEDSDESGDFNISTWPTKSAAIELKSKFRPAPLEILRPSNRVSLNWGPKPRTVTWVAVP